MPHSEHIHNVSAGRLGPCIRFWGDDVVIFPRLSKCPQVFCGGPLSLAPLLLGKMHAKVAYLHSTCSCTTDYKSTHIFLLYYGAAVPYPTISNGYYLSTLRQGLADVNVARFCHVYVDISAWAHDAFGRVPDGELYDNSISMCLV